MANEISSSISIYEVVANVTSTKDIIEKQKFTLYPNPIHSDRVFFSRTLTGQLMNMSGQLVQNFKNVNELSINDLTNGLYFIVADGFDTQNY
ncbi:MAG: T9SS type A sorting domain-containing protein [Saprospiraceae bacterium]|nr:T9SS type A sorting domain-containing protein [Saprospiraceae bacterium]